VCVGVCDIHRLCACQESKHNAYVCVCVRERKRIYVSERVTAYKGERESERARDCVRVCVRERVCVCRENVLACVCHEKKKKHNASEIRTTP